MDAGYTWVPHLVSLRPTWEPEMHGLLSAHLTVNPMSLHGMMLGAASHFSHPSSWSRFSSLSQRHRSSSPSAFPRCASSGPLSLLLIHLPFLSVALAYMSERPVHSNVLPSGSHGGCAFLLSNLSEFAISDRDKDHFCLICNYFPTNPDGYRSA